MTAKQLVRLPAGHWLFRQGDEGDVAFLLESGLLEVWREEETHSRFVAVIKPGDLLGEMSLIDGLARTASVRASKDSLLRTISNDHVNERLETADPLIRMLLKVVLQRSRANVERSGEVAELVSSADRHSVLDRLHLEQDLEAAIIAGTLNLYFQPIVALENGQPLGFECLLRWNHPKKGWISPGHFVRVAETTDLILKLSAWVLEAVCIAAREIERRGHTVFFAINLSGRQLGKGRIVEEVLECVTRHGVSAKMIKLEVTESLLMDNWDTVVEELNEFRALGFKIAVDDFGVGYSSLSYLYRFPVDTLKVDKSFIDTLLEGSGSEKVVDSIGKLAHSLGMQTVAEGIELAAQHERLREMGYTMGQGYYYSKAFSFDDMLAYLRQFPVP